MTRSYGSAGGAQKNPPSLSVINAEKAEMRTFVADHVRNKLYHCNVRIFGHVCTRSRPCLKTVLVDPCHCRNQRTCRRPGTKLTRETAGRGRQKSGRLMPRRRATIGASEMRLGLRLNPHRLGRKGPGPRTLFTNCTPGTPCAWQSETHRHPRSHGVAAPSRRCTRTSLSVSWTTSQERRSCCVISQCPLSCEL